MSTNNNGNNFEWFSWESADQISCSLHRKGQSGTKILSKVAYAGLKSDDDHNRMDWIDVLSLPDAHLQLQFRG